MTKVGLNPDNYGLHSLRSGGITSGIHSCRFFVITGPSLLADSFRYYIITGD